MSDTGIASFDEKPPLAPRGTVVVLVGRGEHPGVYERLGTRLAVDAYRVRVVPGHTDADVAAAAREALGDDPVRPVVLLGSDDGATRATRLAEALGADALVLGGTVPAGQGVAHFDDWAAEVEARTSCPAHRACLDGDDDLHRDAFATGTEGDLNTSVQVPVLALHGAADQVVNLDAVLPRLAGLADREVLVIRGGTHDVFNDIVHRSVAASVVLFLERIRTGGTPIVVPAESIGPVDAAVG